MNANGSGEAEADSSAPEEDDKEVNLDNFMTLDSVGDVDGTQQACMRFLICQSIFLSSNITCIYF